MHRITLAIILLFSATAADAASYQKIDGSIVDPIQQILAGGDLAYSGANLEPQADLSDAVLSSADLGFADLTGADLTGATLHLTFLNNADLIGADLTDADLNNVVLYNADLTNATLTGADLTDATLYYTDFSGADLTNADLTRADLGGSDFSNILYYDDATWTDAYYFTDDEPTWHSGMDTAWRTSEGILALDPHTHNAVPEPSTLLLALFGLALLPRRRRR